ncbi:uncharacterized protein TNCT_413501 [Trichonephila clavata]|uniref:Uncharacterized protein n=1 Tax=Trichonephila clavata TaxID=2740835 RepID=A0A8X6HLF1_TRICU|nr:uncharacterized protein TNCT_413501 [Trichonephila clavata]
MEESMLTNSDEQRELSLEERYIIKSLWSIESNICSTGSVEEKIDKIDKECLECTAKILYKFGELNDEEKQQDSDLAAEKLKIAEEISNPKSKPNACRTCCALSGGAIIGAAIAYLAGAATLAPAIVAVAVFIAATVVGALVGYGIGKFCEKVSEEKQNDPDMSMCTAIKNVLIPECLIHKLDRLRFTDNLKNRHSATS